MTDELRQRIAELEQRVSELESESNPRANSGAENDLLDRYDSYVVEGVESVEKAHPRQIMKLYGEAGVVDTGKQKKRAKRLKKVVAKDE